MPRVIHSDMMRQLKRTEVQDLDVLKYIPDEVTAIKMIPGSVHSRFEPVVHDGPKKFEHESNRPQTDKYTVYKFLNPHTSREKKILKCGFEDCGKLFQKYHNFYDHLRVHTGEKPFECRVAGCHQRFSQKSNLTKHTLNFHK